MGEAALAYEVRTQEQLIRAQQNYLRSAAPSFSISLRRVQEPAPTPTPAPAMHT